MDWEAIAAVAGAVTAVLGAIAAVTGHLSKAWTAGRRWRLRRTSVAAAGEPPRTRVSSREAASEPSPQVDQAIRKRSGVFWIIYRPEDAAGTAQRLHGELSRKFGTENVQLDAERTDALPGDTESFRDVALRSDLALVLIGPEWLRSEDEYARRRLWNPDDPVRRQIAAALLETVVVPILVRGAEMPAGEELPEEISSLARSNALMVTQSNWEADVARVADLAERWG